MNREKEQEMTKAEERLKELGWKKVTSDASSEVWNDKRKGNVTLYKNGNDTIWCPVTIDPGTMQAFVDRAIELKEEARK